MAVGSATSPRIAPPVRTEATKEAQIQEVLKDGPKGVVGQAADYWDDMAAKPGAAGVLGATMSGLLSISGLKEVEKSAAELGARVGSDDSAGNIAKAGGKLALDSALVAMNGVSGAGALRSMAAKGVTKGAGEVTANVVRHYTSAADAAKIMSSGEIWASKAGNAGLDKVYLLAEESGKGGMNLLRRLNIGYADGAKTAKAIEIDLSKVPPEVRARITQAAAKGPLGLENFVTHAGKLDFNEFRGAVRVLDTEKMAVTMDQLAKAGGQVAKFGTAVADARQVSQDVIIRP